ncbi:polyphosphate kinase 1 [Halorientalis pallida]|uniref:Polyphosphate kinase n=1 Tax=Halorientalis pallida TaxID=2479928 RepID=A0A498L0S7_9EURY|nr:polyphosphate kinase 1 [Halorientalis pallida]RXK51890.1 polyphosphate kinase 1 [Halorientalis pallida]
MDGNDTTPDDGSERRTETGTEDDDTDATSPELADSADGERSDDETAAETAGDEAASTTQDVALTDPEYFLNRELSELAFQRRVLEEALDERNPLLERVKFLAIFTKNMDEFFMKRVGGLKQQMAAGVSELTPDGRTPEEQWKEIFAQARPLFAEQTDCFVQEIEPALAEAGIEIVDHDDLDPAVRADLRSYFEESILPTLTPLTFDPAHPFPFISNLSLSMAVLTESEDDPTFTRIKIPENRPRFVRLGDVSEAAGDGTRFVSIDDLLAANLDLLFPDVAVLDHSMFRVTRNAEVRRNEEVAEDLIDMIQGVLQERRFATVVRLEISEDMPVAVRELLVDQLDLADREVVERRGMLDYRDLLTIADLDRPELQRESWTPQPHPRLLPSDGEETDLFAEIKRDDILVHHPYHSFDDTVQRFLRTAAEDPDVLAIKAAIYRTARDSQVIQSLIDAAQNGKQVAVMVELKARFDEENNLRWVQRLEEEGIHVAYGTLGLKTHTKTALVVREEGDTVRQYAHVGTGNYHSQTAKTYVDLGLLTADRDVGQDLVRLFNFFTGHSLYETYRKLLIAPENMRGRFRDLIRNEAAVAEATDGEAGKIVCVMNRLEDPDLVRELYEASMAGVEIDLVVRDICRLRPGIDGVSDTVSVRSIVGRFLEHSRIFYFGNGATVDTDTAEPGEPQYFTGSADWMTRNLDRRVEAITPIEDESLRQHLRAIVTIMLADNRRAWEMGPDGEYERVTPDEGEPVRDTHELLMARTEQAVARARATSDSDPVFDLEDPLARADIDVDRDGPV